MKRLFYWVIVIFILFSIASCRKGKEIIRYVLTDEERSFIPYEESDSVFLQHSSGFIFPLKVIQKYTFWETTESHHRSDDYSSYEVQVVRLTSYEPELLIVFRIVPEQIYYSFSATIYNQPYQLSSIHQPAWDSLEINNQFYEKVFVFTNSYPETPEIKADSIYFNKRNGILKISMTNDEAYYLIP
ncbi:MAG: hypothetical protein CVT92_10480 [Bacteroidetes bacterium HGW-Bacteroidetes-1]|nr:MAG: hypothetical protein CVT92_10480 [Bacteroidetes bacterium HGW-Bacteroidetes-1]